MALPPDVQRRMEEGAAHARVELEAGWQRWNSVDVARWMLKWVSRDVYDNGRVLPGTNYDRAVKLLIEVTGVKPKPLPPVSLGDADDFFSD